MNAQQLAVHTETRGDVVRLSFVGEIDLAVEDQPLAEFDRAAATAGASVVVLDLTGVTFVDSSGLRALLRCRDAARDRGVEMRVKVGDGPVRRLFSLAGVTDWFAHE